MTTEEEILAEIEPIEDEVLQNLELSLSEEEVFLDDDEVLENQIIAEEDGLFKIEEPL